jgi:hypothetical protein
LVVFQLPFQLVAKVKFKVEMVSLKVKMVKAKVLMFRVKVEMVKAKVLMFRVKVNFFRHTSFHYFHFEVLYNC